MFHQFYLLEKYHWHWNSSQVEQVKMAKRWRPCYLRRLSPHFIFDQFGFRRLFFIKSRFHALGNCALTWCLWCFETVCSRNKDKSQSHVFTQLCTQDYSLCPKCRYNHTYIFPWGQAQNAGNAGGAHSKFDWALSWIRQTLKWSVRGIRISFNRLFLSNCAHKTAACAQM